MNISKKYPQSLSPDYDSIPEAEVNESISTSMIPDADALTVPTEEASEAYSALTERPAIIHQPIVYSSLEVCSNPAVFPKEVSKIPSIYVNTPVTIEQSDAILRA